MTDEMPFSIKDLQAGDEKALRQLFGEMYPALCLFAVNYLNDDAEAADVVQECFIRYWKRCSNFDNIYKIRSFLYTSVRNACLNHLRPGRQRLETLDGLSGESYFQDALLQEEALRIFYQAVEKLTGQSRRVIMLALDGKKNDEIADVMGISVNTVHMFKKTAYRKLRELLKEYYYLVFLFLN